MAAVPPAHIISFLYDIRFLQAYVRGGHVSNHHIVTLYVHWSSFFYNLQMNHLLEDPDIPDIDILQVYGHRVHNVGFYSRASVLRSDSVATSWRDISETHILEGLQDPRKTTGLQ